MISTRLVGFFVLRFCRPFAVFSLSFLENEKLLHDSHARVRKIYYRMQYYTKQYGKSYSRECDRCFEKKKLFGAEKASENFTVYMRHTRTNVTLKYSRTFIISVVNYRYTLKYSAFCPKNITQLFLQTTVQ